MTERSIAERLFLEADEARHADLVWFAEQQISSYRDNAPRIDSGEGMICVQERIDDFRESLNLSEDPPLRRVVIEWSDADGYWAPYLEPFSGPFPWEQG